MLCRFGEACWATRCIKAVPATTKMAATTMSNNVFLSFINPLLLSLTPHWKPYPMIGGGTLFRFNQAHSVPDGKFIIFQRFIR